MPKKKIRKKKVTKHGARGAIRTLRDYTIAAVVLAFGCALVLSMLTFAQSDLDGQTAYNLLGKVGAHAGGFFLKLFGLTAFIIAGLCIFLPVSVFAEKKFSAQPEQILGAALLLFGSSMLFDLWFSPAVILDNAPGGVLGSFLVVVSSKLMATKSWIVILSGLMSAVGLILAAQVRIFSLVRFAFKILRAIFVFPFKRLSGGKVSKESDVSGDTDAKVSQVSRISDDRVEAGGSVGFSEVSEAPKVSKSLRARNTVEELLEANEAMPESILIAEGGASKVEVPKKRSREHTKPREHTSGFYASKALKRSGNLNALLAKIKRPQSKSKKIKSLPQAEPAFEFDSIVAPEDMVRTGVLGDWKPRTLVKTPASISVSQAVEEVPGIFTDETIVTNGALLPEKPNVRSIFKAEKFNLTPAETLSEVTDSPAEAYSLPSQPQNRSIVPQTNDAANARVAFAPTIDMADNCVRSVGNFEGRKVDKSFKAFADTVVRDSSDRFAFGAKASDDMPTREIGSALKEEKARVVVSERVSTCALAKSVSEGLDSDLSDKDLRNEDLTDEISEGLISASSVAHAESEPSIVVAQAKQKASREELEMAERLRQQIAPDTGRFAKPPLSLLNYDPSSAEAFSDEHLKMMASKIEQKLNDFNVRGNVVEICPGPVVTRFEYVPAPGIKISKIEGLSNDLLMALEVTSLRVLAPIPGKGAVGFEVPNEKRETVYIKEVIASEAFSSAKSPLTLALGKDVEGEVVVSDLAKMPHLLIAGSTGSGKSVGINTMICSLLYNASPEEVKLLLVDPKCLELSIYNGIPHLLLPPVTEPPKAAQALSWACDEMEERYRRMAEMNVRDIRRYNKKLKEKNDLAVNLLLEQRDENDEPVHKFMPYIVIIIDELADLMMVAAKEIETSIARLAQKARACGIHLILATQRPSVDVLTGLIKANLPTRIAFRVFSVVDSKTILDQKGAESLLGYGDSLFLPPSSGQLVRVHGAYVSDEEVQSVVDFLTAQGEPEYNESILASKEAPVECESDGGSLDKFFREAVSIVASTGTASASMLQRKLGIGFPRASRLIDQLEQEGIIGPANGSKPREVFVSH